MNLFGVLFVRKNPDGTNPELSDKTINHEMIHTEQIKDCLWIFYYPIYLILWFLEVLLPPYPSAYKDTCMERECYDNDMNLNYLKTRKPWNFLKYFKHDRL